LYGKAGTHRPKEDYGVEYRATSNFWLQSPKLTSLVYKLAAFSVEFVANKGHLELWKDNDTCTGYDVQGLRTTIDDSLVSNAKSLMESLCKKYLPADLYAKVFEYTEPVQYDLYREWAISL
jgi:hypothetical protein